MTHTPKHHSPRRSQPPTSGRPEKLKLTVQDQEAICQALTECHRQFHDCFYQREQRHSSVVYLCGQLSKVGPKTIELMLLDLLSVDGNAVRAVQAFIGAGQWAATDVICCHQALVAQTSGDPRGVVIVDGSGFSKQGEHLAGGACQLLDLKQALDYPQTEARRELAITIRLSSPLSPSPQPRLAHNAFHHKHYQATCGH